MPTADINGITLHYDRAGAGEALVFLHAYPTNRTIWTSQVDAFAPDRLTVAYDLRGFGSSSAPSEASKYGQDLSVADLLGLLDTLELSQATLCGLSMGGNIALHFALRYPERVAALILVDTGAGSEDAELFARTTKGWADAAERGGIEKFADVILANPIFAEYADRGSAERRRLHDLITGNSVHGVSHTARCVLAPRLPVQALESHLVRLDVPTLVIVGEADPACHEPGRYLSEKIPGASLAMIPEAGHFNNLEVPDVFNRTCQVFLSKLDNA